MSGFPSFKGHIFQRTPFSVCFQILEFTLCSMFKHSPNGKGVVYDPNEKGIMASVEYTLMIYSPNGKSMDLRNVVLPSCNRHGKR